jgi:putative membrane protein
MNQKATDASGNRAVFYWSLLISGIAIGFLVWLIYIKDTPDASVAAGESVLPAVNAALNSLSTCFLVAGFAAIRKGRIEIHRRLMISAFVSSTLFLITYIIYHNTHGDTPFQGTGIIRPVYFFILISHILLTTVALPMILTTFFFALSGRFAAHKRIARFTFPAWLYVSVTGVMIFFLLKTFS